MNKLTPEQLVLLNQKIIGGDEQPALGKDFNYDSFLILAELPYEKNKELFYECKDVKEKAARLGNLIAAREPFAMGNQETAALAMLTLLDINGKKLINYGDDMDMLYKCLPDSDIEKICKWIDAHLAKEEYIYPDYND